MKEIADKSISNETLTIDDHYFKNCKIKDCTLIYLGGHFGWLDTTFEGCMLRFEGPAWKTIEYLNAFGVLKASFSKSVSLTPTEDPEVKVLTEELERARECLLTIKALQGKEASYYTYTETVKYLIGGYFTKRASGSAEGQGIVGG